jgi:hypothetical protein
MILATGGLIRAQPPAAPRTWTMIKYRRRKDVDRDHASTPPWTPTAAQRPCRVLKRHRPPRSSHSTPR